MDEPKLDSYLEEPKDEFCQVQEERNSIFHSSLSGALTYSTKWFPSSGEDSSINNSLSHETDSLLQERSSVSYLPRFLESVVKRRI